MRGHLGRRGLVLILVAASDIVYGVSLRVAVSSIPATTRASALSSLTDITSLSVWAWAWIGQGVLVLPFAPRRTGQDAMGFVIATLLPLLWAVAYLVAWIRGSYALGWSGAATWVLEAALIMAVGMAVSPSDMPAPPPGTPGTPGTESTEGDVDGQ